MKKQITIALIALTMVMIGCQKKKTEEFTPPPKKAQVIRINNHGSPASFHPHTGIDLVCRIFQKALFEGLTRLNLEGKPELAAASRVDISPSQTTYTFTLRPLQWTNGEPLTAYHFEKAWKTAIAPGSTCLRADLFYPIKNAELAKLGKVSLDDVGIHAPNPQTLVIELEHPAPYFLDLVASPLFSPLYDDSEAPKVFNGPFHIVLLEHDNKMILEKNPSYWDAAHVILEQIHVSFVADPSTAIMLYEKGEIDWVGHPFTNLPPDAIPRLEHSDDFHARPIAGIFWLCLNTERFPLNSAKIRKALSLAINRKSLAQHVLLGETPTESMIPFTMDLLRQTDQSLRAKSLFQEGLEDLHLTHSEFPILTFNHSDVYGQKKIAETIQQCWEKTFGIKVHLQNAEWNVFFANLGQRQFQIGGCIWFAAYNDPSYYLEFFKEKNQRYNAPQWENKHYQQLLELADTETDQAIRLEHIKQAEMLLLEEMPVIPLYIYNAKYLKSPSIKGLTVSDLGQVDFKWAYVE